MNIEAQQLLKQVEVKEPVEPGLYLQLFHGRENRDQDMDDWGADGPYFGPLAEVHITYLNSIRIKLLDGRDTGPMLRMLDPLYFDDDMIFYEGVWYGDWSVLYHQQEPTCPPV